MYEKMRLLPLLQGLDSVAFDGILKFIKLDFNKFHAGDTFIREGDPCDRLVYIIDGEYEIDFRAQDVELMVTERSADVPHLVETYNLFSVQRNYERTYTFHSDGATFQIGRNVFVHKLLKYDVIRNNLINYACNQMRKQSEKKQIYTPCTVEGKIVQCLLSYCTLDSGYKNFRIKMLTLADMIKETRLNVSKVLNGWQDKGLIRMRRNGFETEDIKLLIAEQ